MPIATTLNAFPRPYGSLDPALRIAFQKMKERQTGVVGVTIMLTDAPIVGTLMLFKNGTLLDEVAGAGGYTITDRTVTLGTAAIAGDVFITFYHYRITRTG